MDFSLTPEVEDIRVRTRVFIDPHVLEGPDFFWSRSAGNRV
jgi:hypothetical protein